jgi:4-aminobutyrate aminotransferase-like enzyme/Ser/Thr protein kinase RdoA (MazF antagonist)
VEYEGRSDWLLARPEVDAERVLSLARDHFGVTGDIRELGSQQDRNFLIASEGSRAILFKVNNRSVTESSITLQASVSDRMREAGIRTPEILHTATGSRFIPIVGASGETTLACAFEVVDGETLADIAELDGALAEELGSMAARTTSALEGLEHEGADREIQWELSRALQVVKGLLHELPDDRQEICKHAAIQASSMLDGIQDELPKQIIHGDLTSDNIMRDRAGTNWIVDLGDTSLSWRVAELAVLAADVLGRTGDLAIVGRAVAGFSAEANLSDAEIQAVWPLVVLRGGVLAVSGWSQLSIDPGNTYARERLEHEWQVFERSIQYDFSEVEAQLRLSAGRPHIRGREYAPVLAGMNEAQSVDLGVRSELLDRGRWLDPLVEQELAREALSSAPVAVMRFGESRLTRVSSDVMSPAPTKARFVELWTEPGAPVHAPFDGTVVAGEGFVELNDRGVTLRFEGIDAVSGDGSVVPAGETLGHAKPHAPGLGRIIISRRMLGAASDPQLGGSVDEYETLGAANPSVLVGTAAVVDPIVELNRERQRRDRAMGGAAERYYLNPPQIERGWNTLLIDTQGRAYLDMVNNVTAIGHSHPRLADTVGRQLHLLNTNSRFLYKAYADFSDKLLENSPDPSLDTVIPVNSGSEAIDLAIRLAQAATGRRDLIAAREGYHGWTMGADSVSTSAFDNPAALASRPSWVHLVDAPNPYRGTYRGDDSGPKYADQVADLARELVEANKAPAAFICEPVLGNAGGVIPPEGFLARAYEAIRGQGGLAIADEVQVGYGRLGKAFWGSALQGAVPDIIAVAKAAGNAYPLGAVITRREIVDALQREGMFFSSSGGAPASAIAGSAVLDVIREEGLQGNAAIVGDYLIEGIQALGKKHALIGPVHGSGLYLGVELIRNAETLEPATAETARICERLLRYGVIMQATSERQNVLKVKPPLTLTQAEADVFIAALDAVLSDLETQS